MSSVDVRPTSVPQTLGDHQRRIQILEGVLPAGGEGLQFNSGTYGPDNVGDWLIVETDTEVTQDFSLPAGNDGDTTFSVGFNATPGVLFTTDPSMGYFPVTIEVISANSDSTRGLEIICSTTGGGSSNVTGIDIAVDNDGNGRVTGILSAPGKAAGTGTVTAYDASSFNAGTGEAVGVYSESRATGGGNSVGVRSRARVSGGGSAFCYEGYDNANTLIFQIDDSGNIHIPIGSAVIPDL